MLENLIAGEWVDGPPPARNANPSDTRDVAGERARADAAQARQAIDAAQARWTEVRVFDNPQSLNTRPPLPGPAPLPKEQP